MAVKVKKPTKARMMKTVNPEITHHEPNPYDLNEFVERMMVLGYSYNTIVEQCVLKYKCPRHNAEERVKYIRKSWIEYGNLESEEKKAVLEQQLNHLYRVCLDKDELSTAAVVIKRKMELAGIETNNKGKTAVNYNLNIGQQGLAPEDILPKELIEERALKLAEANKKI